MKIKNLTKHPIYIGVISSLIFTGIIGIVPYLRQGAITVFKLIWRFMFLERELTNWKWILLLSGNCLLIWLLVKKLISVFRMKLSDEEIFVLAALAIVDGQSVSQKNIAIAIKRSNIQTEHAIDILKKKDYVADFYDQIDGSMCYLTAEGRRIVIKYNLIKKTKEG
ncbi:hypothetical protein KJ633_02800 [bacterium]|nr:hypothetical protein [bacterium]